MRLNNKFAAIVTVRSLSTRLEKKCFFIDLKVSTRFMEIDLKI